MFSEAFYDVGESVPASETLQAAIKLSKSMTLGYYAHKDQQAENRLDEEYLVNRLAACAFLENASQFLDCR